MSGFLKSALGPATADEKRRHQACRDAGCEACHQLGLPKAEHCGRPEYHHFTDAGRQIGHRYGCSLYSWHHQGTVKPGWTIERMLEKYGPNLKDEKGAFFARFGTPQALQNGQDDRIGWPREEIPSRRQLRMAGEHNPRHARRTTASSKTFPRGGLPS